MATLCHVGGMREIFVVAFIAIKLLNYWTIKLFGYLVSKRIRELEEVI